MFSLWNKHWRRVAKFLTGCAALLSTACLPGTSARAELDPALTRSIEEPAGLKFQYRLFPAAEVETIRVTQNGKPLEYRHTLFTRTSGNTSALLVLVDTSIGTPLAPRDRTLQENKRLIQALLAQAELSLSVGVCAFASDLVEVAPLGAPFGEIQSRLGGLRADGQGTRLYRQGIRAMEKLAAAPAARKALLILSDGKDEDSGLTRADLVKAALQAHVTLFAMGCPETGADIPFLGNLEKLAAETRGLYAQARIGIPGPGERIKADAAFVHEVLTSLNSGGEVVVPLPTVAEGAEVVFEIVAKGGETFRYVHTRGANTTPTPPPRAIPAIASVAALPAATHSPLATPSPTQTPAPPVQPSAAPLRPTQRPAPTPQPVLWLQAVWTPGNLISASAALLLILAVLILRHRKPQPAPAPLAPPPSAYLQMQDAESRRIPLTKPASRIGRRPENDIVFANTSVSGYHAEIHAQRDGTYRITDLGSGNGLRVNDQSVAQAALANGDLVELGEVRFRFYRG